MRRFMKNGVYNIKEEFFIMSDKLKVAVLGGTGMVGQRFIDIINNHPWFEVTTIAAIIVLFLISSLLVNPSSTTFS